MFCIQLLDHLKAHEETVNHLAVVQNSPTALGYGFGDKTPVHLADPVVSSLSPDLGVNSAIQQDRAAPNRGATRTIKRMNSFEALQHEFGDG